MRFIVFSIFINCIISATANTQNNTNPSIDFSGIYAPPAFVAVVPVSEPDTYPFTTEGLLAFNSYDPLADSPSQTNDCTPDLMPGILWSNSPMEFSDEGNRVIISYERGNTTRTIHMDNLNTYAENSHTALGHSSGRWIENILTIETTLFTSKNIRNNRGYPVSSNAKITERYWRESGENDLKMELIVDDPVNYTQPFTLGREWVWAPHEELQEYECINLGARHETPDIDELARMLEEL